MKPSTDQLHNLAVQGPASRDVLSEIIWSPDAQPKLAELKWFRFLIGRVGTYDGTPVIVLTRSGGYSHTRSRSASTPNVCAATYS